MRPPTASPFRTRRVLGVVVGGVLALALAGSFTVPTFRGGSPESQAATVAPERDALAPILAEDAREPLNPGAVIESRENRVSGRVASAVLAEIPVKGKASDSGYDRVEQFGPAWSDVDGNGCDTRNDILTRDLTNITVDDRCRVLTGTLLSPYSGETIQFVRGPQTSQQVQIDHVVALHNSWLTGAQQLDDTTRRQFANDPLNLLAVDGRSNSQKGSADAATWLPANRAFRCEYVARQIGAKANYDLWVVRAEADAMTRVLNTCPGQRVP